MAAAMPALPGPGEASFTSLNHTPAPPKAAPGLLQGPGTQAAPEPHGPWGLPTLSSALPTLELQDVSVSKVSATAKGIQTLRNHPIARLRLNQSNATPLQTQGF